MRVGAILGLMVGLGAAMSIRPAEAAIAIGAVTPVEASGGSAYAVQQVDWWHHGHHWHHRRWSQRYHHWIYW